MCEGAVNNYPDDDAHRAANMIERKANALTQDDIALVLISGNNNIVDVTLIHGGMYPSSLKGGRCI